MRTANQAGAAAGKSTTNPDPYRSDEDVTVNLPNFKNNKWTKLITIGESAASSIHLHLLQSDFEKMRGDPLKQPKASKKPWELLFDPDLLEQQHEELLMDNFKLS